MQSYENTDNFFRSNRSIDDQVPESMLLNSILVKFIIKKIIWMYSSVT